MRGSSMARSIAADTASFEAGSRYEPQIGKIGGAWSAMLSRIAHSVQRPLDVCYGK